MRYPGNETSSWQQALFQNGSSKKAGSNEVHLSAVRQAAGRAGGSFVISAPETAGGGRKTKTAAAGRRQNGIGSVRQKIQKRPAETVNGR